MTNNRETSPRQDHPPIDHGLAATMRVWQILNRRKWRILLVVVLGLVGATAYCSYAGPRYDSGAQLLVIKKRLDTTPLTGPDQVRVQDEYLSTHMLLATSRKVVGRAIEKGYLKDLEQFRNRRGIRQEINDWVSRNLLGVEPEPWGDEKLISEIIDSLVVSRDAQRPGISPSNEVFNLTIRGSVADDCPRILNAIISSYQEFLQETYRNTNAETMELIAQARAAVHEDLEKKEAAYQEFLAETPLLLRTPDRSSAQQDRLLKIDAKLAALRVRRSEIEASIAMIEDAVNNGRNPTATVIRLLTAQSGAETAVASSVASLDASFADRRSRVSLEEELVVLLLQKAKLEAIHARNHADVVAINNQVQIVRRMLISPAGSLIDTSDGANSREVDLGVLKVELLKQELDDLKVAEKQLAKLFENEQEGISAAYLHEIQNEAHRKGIERDRQLYESILVRLKETSSVRDFGGYTTQVIGPARVGEVATKRYLLIYGLAVFASIFLGFGWAYFAEMGSRRSQITMSV